MSAHVLLILLKELEKRDKMWGLPSILSLFPNKLNKLNNTRAGMLDSIHHMTLRLLWNPISCLKVIILYMCMLWTSWPFPKICKPLVVYQFLCMALFHSQTQRHVIKLLFYNYMYSYSMYTFFVCFNSSRPSQQFFSYVGNSLPVLNQYLAEDKVSCSITQSNASSEPRTHKPSILSKALHHCAKALLFYVYKT